MNWVYMSLAAFGLTAPTLAQDTTSRPIVQPLPSAEVRDLNQVLKQLARKPRDLDTLIEAGSASLKLNDLDAAIGFYGRAEEVAPNNPRVKMGMAAVFLRSGKAIEALQLFSEAEAAGASARDVLSDRGLAYDLVGDQVRAQAHYNEALRTNPDDSVTIRRLALSQAIAGEQLAFEATLRPLIAKREFAAFRAQAFGLAILGKQGRAAAITGAVMPRDLAGSITPYLEFMPRLTKAQQAAAANLGIFPPPADIGREDPRIAALATESPSVVADASAELARSVSDRLEPAGEPLGEPTGNSPEPAAQLAANAAATSVPPAQAVVLQTVPSADPAPPSADTERGPAVTQLATEQSGPALAENAAADTRPGFDLRSAAGSQEPAVNTAPQPTPVRVVRAGATQSVAGETKPSFSDAFADLGTAEAAKPVASGDAVDLAAIDIQRENKPAAQAAKPRGPEHPSRIWIQVATGKDRQALSFDWRRISRKAPNLLADFKPHIVAWGQSNRLLAGPVESRSAARNLVNDLAEAGLDTFSYTSPEGAEIQELK